MLLSGNAALIGGNSTKPGSTYYALINAALSRSLISKRGTVSWLAEIARDRPNQGRWRTGLLIRRVPGP